MDMNLMKFLLDSYIEKGFDDKMLEETADFGLADFKAISEAVNRTRVEANNIADEALGMGLETARKFYKQGFKDAIELLTKTGEADEKK
ncbi:MAG: hypothetical protein FWG63_03895 [Defluviitaleaceae bacterium]|nr:hypothetical protein [Defluviitaleaceae bacterium]